MGMTITVQYKLVLGQVLDNKRFTGTTFDDVLAKAVQCRTKFRAEDTTHIGVECRVLSAETTAEDVVSMLDHLLQRGIE